MFIYKHCPNCPDDIQVEVYEEGTIEQEIECQCGARLKVLTEFFIYVNEIEGKAKEAK